MALTALELCAGAGGQALGLERAGFEHMGLIENDAAACQTLRVNRPDWNVIEHDLFESLPLDDFKGVDLIAGGLPCPPFSVAGKQLGERDERNLFNIGLQYVAALKPRAVMFENVRGIFDPSFDDYRTLIARRLRKWGYDLDWKLLNASDYGVPQLRPRAILVAIKRADFGKFRWPKSVEKTKTVGDELYDLMEKRGWKGAEEWRKQANKIGPTVVGGSKKHGGPDLGPTRARKAWAELGVDGRGIANEEPGPEHFGMPRLTVRMVARLQGFPDDWEIYGRKTAAYRQVGNVFPPPVAERVGLAIAKAIKASRRRTVVSQAQVRLASTA